MPPSDGPKLLISVRDAPEARIAYEAGAELIDLKEPDNGSLGAVSASRLADVNQCLQEINPLPLCSAACGEVHEYQYGSNQPVPQLPEVVTLAKFGLSQLAGDSNWEQRWARARQQIDAGRLKRSIRPLRWVAVCYADVENAASPSAEEVIHAASSAGCAGVLFDTCHKRAARLTERFTTAELAAFAEQVHARGMFCAMAGGVCIEDVASLCAAAADVIAVRSAACENGQRTGPVSALAIQELKNEIRWAAGKCSAMRYELGRLGLR